MACPVPPPLPQPGFVPGCKHARRAPFSHVVRLAAPLGDKGAYFVAQRERTERSGEELSRQLDRTSCEAQFGCLVG